MHDNLRQPFHCVRKNTRRLVGSHQSAKCVRIVKHRTYAGISENVAVVGIPRSPVQRGIAERGKHFVLGIVVACLNTPGAKTGRRSDIPIKQRIEQRLSDTAPVS